MTERLKTQALHCWQAGVAAVDGYTATKAALAPDNIKPDLILAVGKAAAAMTRAARDHFGGIATLVVTKDGHGGNLPADVTLLRAVTFTPTFVLLVDGIETQRIEGYPGEDFFWGLLGTMLDQADVPYVIKTDAAGSH